jgi:hypothetical protein
MVHYQMGKRLSRRYSCSHRVQFNPLSSIYKDVDNRARQAALLNISKHGVGMRIRGESLNEGSLVTVRMPTSVRTVTVPVLAEVMWAKEERPGEYQAGLRFVM